ncbi:MAG: helix-turn-helix domain-containing protein [Chloroflexota bacterium]|nr:helix-turn-helix domain-containing protein [Chloroflexota bacterium]
MIVNGQTFYRTSEACQMVGISRSTLLRWVKEGSLDIREYRDRRKWRLFTEQEIDKLSLEANRVSVDR